MITPTGADADLALHDLGHEHVVLDLLLDEEEDRDAERQRRRHVNATTMAGIAASIGPTIGIISPIAAISAST